MRFTLVAVCFIAVLFALCILVAGLVIFKCVKKRRTSEPTDSNSPRQPINPPSFGYPPQSCCPPPQKDPPVENFAFYHLPPPYPIQDPYKFQENTYSSISELAAQIPSLKSNPVASPTLSLRLQAAAAAAADVDAGDCRPRQPVNSDLGKPQVSYQASSATQVPATFQRIQQQQQQQQLQQQHNQHQQLLPHHHHHHHQEGFCYQRDAVKTSPE